jgi:hypothetical protein
MKSIQSTTTSADPAAKRPAGQCVTGRGLDRSPCQAGNSPPPIKHHTPVLPDRLSPRAQRHSSH